MRKSKNGNKYLTKHTFFLKLPEAGAGESLVVKSLNKMPTSIIRLPGFKT